MKTATAYTQTQRYAARQEPVWLLDLSIAGTTWRAATRAIVFDGENYPALLATAPDWRMQPAGDFGPGGLIETAAEIRALDSDAGATSLRAKLQTAPPLGVTVTLRLLWTDAASTWTEADAVTMLNGVVVEWRNEPAAVVLALRDCVSAVGAKRIGRVLHAAMIDHASPLIGGMLPIVIGTHDAIALEPLRSGASAKLAAPLGPGDLVATLTGVENFPSIGTAQIGDELVAYTALDTINRTLGTAAQPIARGQHATTHSAGEPVRSVPAGGFEWLVADHACALVDDVRADGEALDPADWTAQLRAIGGIDSQIVTMPKWPVRLRFEQTPRSRPASEFIETPYTTTAETTALNPQLAIDDKRTSTAARLASGAGLLAFDIANSLAIEGPHLGRWAGARLRVRYSATQRWAAGSQLLVRFSAGGASIQAAIPRPSASEGEGTLEAAPGESATAVITPIGIRDFEFDLASLIDPAAGWAIFSQTPQPQMEIEFIPAADPAEILIHDFEIVLDYFPKLPAEEARELTARVEGWMNDAEELIENPADVIELLITHARFANLGVGAIDAATLDAARALLAAKSFTFARRITGGPALRELIDAAARECAHWIRAGGAAIALSAATVQPSTASSLERLDDARALDPRAQVRLTNAEGFPTHDCLTLATARAIGGNIVSRPAWHRCSAAGEQQGAIPAVRRLGWLDGRAAAALAHTGERIWSWLREPLIDRVQSFPLGAALLEPGDIVTAHEPPLALIETPCWIESVRIESPRALVRMRGHWAGEFCWEHDAQTFLRIFGFGARTIAVINGVAAAQIDDAGNLSLRGALRERANFAAGPFAAEIVYDSGFLYWCTGTAGVFTPFARIDANGDMHLNGAAREQSAITFTTGAECHAATSDSFRLSPRPFAAAIEFRAGEITLHLAGRISERADL